MNVAWKIVSSVISLDLSWMKLSIIYIVPSYSNDLNQGFPTFNLLCPPKPKYQMLRPPKKKSGPPKKTCSSFYVRIHYYSIRKKYHSVSRCNSKHKLLIFEKKHSKLPLLLQILQFVSFVQTLASPLPTSCVPPGGRVPQVGNPWSKWSKCVSFHDSI